MTSSLSSYFLSVILIVAIVGFVVIFTNSQNLAPGIIQATDTQINPNPKQDIPNGDLSGQGFRATQLELEQGIQRYCRCIRGSSSVVVDNSWDPAITQADVWNPPLATGAVTGCGSYWVTSICQQDAGSLSAVARETWKAGTGSED